MRRSDDDMSFTVETGSWAVPAPPRWKTHPLRHRRRPRPATFRVRVDLSDAKPPIWRRLDLASDLYLDDLHVVLQVAMGWTNSHMHAFSVGGGAFGRDSFRFLNDFDVAERERGTPASNVRLDETMAEPGDRLFYEYDFGDSWSHVLKLESAQPRRADDPAFVCVGGRRACPPEDCGGIYGYQELLDYLADPSGAPDGVRERAEYFLGDGGFDPARFDIEATNRALDSVRA